MNAHVNKIAFDFEQAKRANNLFSAIVLAALDDAIADEKSHGDGSKKIANWARSRDGKTILACAGIDPNERVVDRIVDFVAQGKRTSTCLSRESSKRAEVL